MRHWSFCERWRNIDGSIFADTGIVLRHIGKYPYALWNVQVVKQTKDGPQPPPPGFDLGENK